MFKLSVGPVLYYWSRATLTSFYADLVESPVSTICLGEVVCSRRHDMKSEDWLSLARELTQAGKEVVIGTQALLETEAELRTMRRWVEHGEFMLEANDVAAVQLIQGRAPWVIGLHMNVYSAPTLREYGKEGAVRWVPPVEMALDDVATVNPHGAALESEVFAFGRMPLALSARCFTARHHGLQKDVCGFRCLDDPDGLNLQTRDGEPFLAINGIQTQSGTLQCLIGQRDAMVRFGVHRLRLSPVSRGFDDVVRQFDAVFNQGAPAQSSMQAIASMGLPGPLANGYVQRWHAGRDWVMS